MGAEMEKGQNPNDASQKNDDGNAMSGQLRVFDQSVGYYYATGQYNFTARLPKRRRKQEEKKQDEGKKDEKKKKDK